MNPKGPYLEFDHVSKAFGPRPALTDVAFVLDRPGVTGLVGPNGAGKTTTLRLAAGFFPPTQGEVLLGGTSYAEEELALKATTGYLPERPPLYPDMTVQAYLEFVGRIKNVPGPLLSRRGAEVCDDCGLQDVMHRRIGALSAGFKQRTGLAAALVPDPRLLLLDEPMAHLDPLQREQMLGLIAGEGDRRAVLFSSHLLSEVEDISGRVLVLQRGRLLADGPPGDIGSGSVVVRLKLRAAGRQLTDGLSSLPGVDAVRLRHESDGVSTLEVRGALAPEDMARAVVEQGWPLLELSSSRGGIESLLREVPKGESKD